MSGCSRFANWLSNIQTEALPRPTRNSGCGFHDSDGNDQSLLMEMLRNHSQVSRGDDHAPCP